MPRYNIKVNESWVNQCTVEADSPGEAIEKMLGGGAEWDNAEFYCFDRNEGMPIAGNEILANELEAHEPSYVNRDKGMIPIINSIEVEEADESSDVAIEESPEELNERTTPLIRVTLIDQHNAVHGLVHWLTVLDAISVTRERDTQTIEELLTALRLERAMFEPGLNHLPTTAGIAFIDLPARLFTLSTTRFATDMISSHDKCWMFLTDVTDWIIHAAERRRQRTST